MDKKSPKLCSDESSLRGLFLLESNVPKDKTFPAAYTGYKTDLSEE